MFTPSRIVRVLVATLAVSFAAVNGMAAQRTFVSTAGSDSNPCTRTLPCRSFTAANLLTDAGGEIVALDTGGYGAVTIDQSVALVAPSGVHAAVSVFAGNAITVDAGPSDVVVVRGLYLTGLGGARGISFVNGATLHVENCVVSGFATSGIFGAVVGGDVFVKDTISRNNFEGFRFEASGPPGIRASLDAIRAEENGAAGVAAYGNSIVTVTGSVSAGNGAGSNLYAGVSGVLNVEDSVAAYAFYGVYATNGTVRVSNSMITGNTTGVAVGPGGSTISFGNNSVDGNNTNGTFTSTIAQQ